MLGALADGLGADLGWQASLYRDVHPATPIAGWFRIQNPMFVMENIVVYCSGSIKEYI